MLCGPIVTVITGFEIRRDMDPFLRPFPPSYFACRYMAPRTRPQDQGISQKCSIRQPVRHYLKLIVNSIQSDLELGCDGVKLATILKRVETHPGETHVLCPRGRSELVELLLSNGVEDHNAGGMCLEAVFPFRLVARHTVLTEIWYSRT